MKKRLLATLLVLSITLTLLPGTALAAMLMGGTILPAETEFTINGVTVTKASGKSFWNCSKYAVEILNQIWNVTDAMSTFDSPYNMLGSKSMEERTLTEEHVRSYIQAAPLGSRIRVCADSGTTANNKDNNSQGHTMVLAAKDDAAGTFTVLHAGWGGAAASQYTYSDFANYYSERRNYNYFFYIANYAAADPSSTISGRCGDSAWWSFSPDTGVLTVSGSGRMTDYNRNTPPPWQKHSNAMTAVSIQYGITSIGSCAFSHSRSLTGVTIPASVTRIGSDAFSFCGLTSVEIPDSVTDVQSSAFAGCSELSEVTLSNRLKYIAASLFSDCGSLTSVTIPSSIAWIGIDAFRNCENLTDIYYSGTAEQWNHYITSSASSLMNISPRTTNIIPLIFFPPPRMAYCAPQ